MFPHKSWPLGSSIPTDNFLSPKHLRACVSIQLYIGTRKMFAIL